MAWKIDRDYISDPNRTQVGRASAGRELMGSTFRFRLRDSDGEIYYGGVADVAAAEDDLSSGGLYDALQWATYYDGCTDLQVHPTDALEHGLTSVEHLERHPEATRSGWVSIY